MTRRCGSAKVCAPADARRLGAARNTLLALAILALTITAGACGGSTGQVTTKVSRSATASPYPLAPVTTAVAPGDWQRFDYDAQRSGVYPSSTGIDRSDLGSLQRRVVHLSGVVDSSAVELHGVRAGGRIRDLIFITTTYGKTLAIDPATGATVWRYVPRDIAAYRGSRQITTATPIIDPDRAYLYAASPDGFIHKLTVPTGAEVRSAGWPARVTLDPTHEKIAAALNISGGSVVVVTGGYIGDAPPYQGHVVMIDRATGRITHVFNSLCSNRHGLMAPSSCLASGSAIWARSGAVIEPGSGRILVATGNGPFNGRTDWGDSVLELSPDAARLLHNWTPRDQAQLDATDTDLGSTAPALVSVAGYRLAVQGGKDGQLHLLDLNALNGTRGGPGSQLGGELEDVSSPGGGQVLTAPAVWSRGGRVYVFVADDSGTAAYVVTGGRKPRLVTAWQNRSAGTSPVVAGSLLYVYDQLHGWLNVYDPIGGRLLRSLPAAAGHWSSPIVVGGRIILPTGGGSADDASHSSLFIYHLPGR
jgi:outer membrane protein assembly factor BamB